MEKRSASDNDINMKKGNFHVTYNVSSTKKRIFILPRGAERPNGDFSYFRVARKGQMENFRASAWRGKTKKRGFRCYSAARKDQKENLGVTAWRGKA